MKERNRVGELHKQDKKAILEILEAHYRTGTAIAASELVKATQCSRQGFDDYCLKVVGVSWNNAYGDNERRVIEALRHDLAQHPAPRQAGPVSPLPTDSAARKEIPLWEGTFGYFPASMAEMARTSYKGNQKHREGLPLGHSRGKSNDHSDCVARHLLDYQAMSKAGAPVEVLREELGNLCWRAHAFAQEELEKLGVAPLAPRAIIRECSATTEPTAGSGESDESPATDSTRE